LGKDSKGNRYYYFGVNWEDCRLYREQPPALQKKPGKARAVASEPQWDTVCTTLEEVQAFADALCTTRSKADKGLIDALTKRILPKLAETANARRRAEERQAALEALPRKRSNRLQVAKEF
jgi:hypothetical protein